MISRGRPRPREAPLTTSAYRSRLEAKIGLQLRDARHPFEYEQTILRYWIPERSARYTPDFDLKNGIIIEAKGWLTPADRKKMVLVKAQHPEIDIRFVFQDDPNKRYIYKGSPTSYAKWCDDHGFPYAGFGKIPDSWLT